MSEYPNRASDIMVKIPGDRLELEPGLALAILATLEEIRSELLTLRQEARDED